MSNPNQQIDLFRSRFIQALTEHCQVKTDDRLLVAVSGGADSMALLHLLLSAGYHCVVAHCNFSLRGAESDGDEDFVRAFCLNHQVSCHVKRFDTLAYASEQKISMEMAARDLRYSWFNQLMEMEELAALATGHHGNDAIETFFLNLARGTGMRGLTGIPWKRGTLIRPLLFAQTSDIIAYCQAAGLTFRTDSSNQDTEILRNKVRHQIIPMFLDMNPAFFQTMQSTMQLMRENYDLLQNEVERFKETVVAQEAGTVLIPLSLLRDHPQRKSLLFEILRPYGFKGAIMDDIVLGLDSLPGKQYLSETRRLVRDRYNLILVEKGVEAQTAYYIQAGEPIIAEPLNLKLTVFERTPEFRFSIIPTIAHFDADLIDFPLEIRRWQTGDQFQPLGMTQFKKLSDFFIDEKYTLIDKERSWLLTSNSEVIWVVGKRLDNRVKVTSKTRRILEVNMGEEEFGK